WLGLPLQAYSACDSSISRLGCNSANCQAHARCSGIERKPTTSLHFPLHRFIRNHAFVFRVHRLLLVISWKVDRQLSRRESTVTSSPSSWPNSRKRALMPSWL